MKRSRMAAPITLDQRWRRRALFESLESRQLLAGNLRILDVQFLDGESNPISIPTVGEQIRLRAAWEATDVDASYRLRFLHDSVPLTSALFFTPSTVPGQAVGAATIQGGWFAGPGEHRIEVTVDSANSVAETNETDNRFVINYSPQFPSTLTQKMVQPLAGAQNEDWAVRDYVDVDPRAQVRDYNGGNFSANRSTGIDIPVPNASEVDRGLPLFAAAPGVVISSGGRARDGMVLNGFEDDEGTGSIVQSVGDVNGDGISDLAVVSIAAERVYVVFGHDGPYQSTIELADLLEKNGGDGSRGLLIADIPLESFGSGDFNGDGLSDLIVGVPGESVEGFEEVGRTYVLFGSSQAFPAELDLSLLLAANGGDGSRGFVLNGSQEFDRSGTVVSGIGDINGDQVVDLAVAAPRADVKMLLDDDADEMLLDVGVAYVLFGSQTAFPAELALDSLESFNGGDGSKGFVLRGVDEFDEFGQWLSSAGDLNHDGIGDLAIGTVGKGFFGSTGEGYVVFGKTEAWEPDFDVIRLFPPPPPPPPPPPGQIPPIPPLPPVDPPPPPPNIGDGSEGFVIPGLGFFDMTAVPIGSAGDLNRDGIDDLYVSASGADGAASGSGLCYLIYGQSTPFTAEFDLNSLWESGGGNGTKGAVLLGVSSLDQTATSLAGIGDFNGDGGDDLLIGAPGAGSAGESYLLFGRTGGFGAEFNLGDLANGDGTRGLSLTGAAPGDAAGSSVSSAGDVNRDGIADLIIGAPAANGSGIASGASFVLFGRTATLGPSFSLGTLPIPDDLVEVDYGNGWRMRYHNVNPLSLTVQIGDRLDAGQVLGLLGIDASRAAPIFRFQVLHNGTLVDTYQDPTAYWLQPLQYQGGMERAVLRSGLTNVDPAQDIAERPSEFETLHPTFTGSVHFWFEIGHLNTRDTYEVTWYRPDGTVDTRSRYCINASALGCVGLFGPSFHSYESYETLTPVWSQLPGRWTVTLSINDQEKVRRSFDIVSQPLVPQLRVSHAKTIVLNGRSTAFDFGRINRTDNPADMTFRLQNHGSTVLNSRLVQVPVGFSLTTPFPSQINPTEHADITLRLDPSPPGLKFGELRFTTDDPNQPTFRFPVTGFVRGAIGIESPMVTLSPQAVHFPFRSDPVFLDPLAEIIDLDSSSLEGGELIVDLLAGGQAGDQLQLQALGDEDTGIHIVGGRVSVNGIEVGVIQGGANATPLVIQFTNAATPTIAPFLLRNVQFFNDRLIPDSPLRTVGVTLVDNTARRSPLALRHIVVTENRVNQVPTIESLTVSPEQVTKPGLFTITAGNVADFDGTVSEVAFYRESNAIVGLQLGAGGDTRLGTDANAADDFSLTVSSAVLPIGPHTAYAVAFDNTGAGSLPISKQFQVTEVNQSPSIIFLSADPTRVAVDGRIQLTAGGVTDPDDPIARVEFYRESNFQPGLQTGAGGDFVLGSDAVFSGGWTLSFDTLGLPESHYTIHARAVDLRGAISNEVSAQVTVGNPPPANAQFPLEQLTPAGGGNGSAGLVIEGNTANTELGTTATAIGDINADGFDDFLVAAPSATAGAPAQLQAGAVYVVFGRADFSAASVDISTLNGLNGFSLFGGQIQGRLGTAATALGDMNGDGISDFAISAPTWDGSAPDNGLVFVIYGRSGGFFATLDVTTLNGSNGFAIQGPAAGAQLGMSLSAAGDVNGDGLADLIAGANVVGQGVRAYVVFGRVGVSPSTITVAALNGTNGFAIVGRDGAGNVFGAGDATYVSSAGDFNGDGLGDLVVGGRGPSGSERFVLFGGTGPWNSVVNVASLTGSNGFSIFNLASSRHQSASAGDVNGDGFNDLLVGADLARSQAGDAYLFFGRSLVTTALDAASLDGSNGFQFQGRRAGDNAGAAIAGVGDMNADGYDDLLIGAPNADPGSPARLRAGEAYLLFGGPTSDFSPTLGVDAINGENGIRFTGVLAGDRTAASLGGAADINGDGFEDFIVGVPSADPGTPTRSQAGAAFVVFGADFTQSVDQKGDRNSNVLTGSILSDRIVGGSGDDALLGNGGIDVLRGGQGNDSISVLDATFTRIDGGTGSDTLRVDGAGIQLNLRTMSDHRITGIEQIDLTGVGNNSLLLSVRDVLALSDTSNTLQITRNDGDTVDIGTGWTLTNVQVLNGRTFNTFRQGVATVIMQAIAEGAPWQNPSNPLDVTNNGIVTAEDALQIINYINRSATSALKLPNPFLPSFAPRPVGNEAFYDVSGDEFATALDALLVINFLNHQSTGGEGESFRIEQVVDASHTDRAIEELFTTVPTPAASQDRTSLSSLWGSSDLPNSMFESSADSAWESLWQVVESEVRRQRRRR